MGYYEQGAAAEQGRSVHLVIIIMLPGNIERTPQLTIVHPKQHRHTLIWIHGLGQNQQTHLTNIILALGSNIDTVKLVCPRAPKRHVDVLNKTVNSWFNFGPRAEDSFIRPFDEVFSSAEVEDSYQRVLLPLMEEESRQVKEKGGKLIMSGFSQGCGMSIHCLYHSPTLVDAAIGVSGYFFPITHYDPKIKQPIYLVYGLADDLRPWQHVKVTYYGRLSQKQMTFLPGVKHEVTSQTAEAMAPLINQILGVTSKI